MDVRQKRNKVLGERVVKALESRNMDAYYAETKEEAVQKALEWIPEGSTINMGGASSVHECGLSEDGVFINIDGNANRVAAYAFGPKNVLLIVGMNKVVKTQEDAMSRARNEAAPVNAQRFGIDTPCSKAGSCFDCKSPECICCQILVTRFSRQKGRFKIILVDENLGF